jgi:tetratricopeptide (TPR) repeat protein
VRIFREILTELEPAEGADSPKVLNVVLNLATALDSAGESAEALAYFERVVAGRRRIYGAKHPALGEALVITSLRLSRAGRSVEALAGLAEARAIYEPLDHPELGSVDNYTGLALSDLGRFAEAERAFERASARFAKDPGAGALLAASARSNEAYAVSEKCEEAVMFKNRRRAATCEFDNPRLLRLRFNWARPCAAPPLQQAAPCSEPGSRRVKLDAGLQIAEGGQLTRLTSPVESVAERPAAVERARARLAAVEAITATKAPSPALARSLVAARAELDRSGGN